MESSLVQPKEYCVKFVWKTVEKKFQSWKKNSFLFLKMKICFEEIEHEKRTSIKVEELEKTVF